VVFSKQHNERLTYTEVTQTSPNNFKATTGKVMKPINAETKAKKSPAKGAAGAKKGPKAVAGTVKKSVSKAKTNVVKASRKKLNKAAKEEVDELLDKTANGSPDVVDGAATTTVAVTPSASGKAVAVAAAKTKKIKSMVSLNSYNKMEEEPVTPHPTVWTRMATRLTDTATSRWRTLAWLKRQWSQNRYQTPRDQDFSKRPFPGSGDRRATVALTKRWGEKGRMERKHRLRHQRRRTERAASSRSIAT